MMTFCCSHCSCCHRYCCKEEQQLRQIVFKTGPLGLEGGSFPKIMTAGFSGPILIPHRAFVNRKGASAKALVMSLYLIDGVAFPYRKLAAFIHQLLLVISSYFKRRRSRKSCSSSSMAWWPAKWGLIGKEDFEVPCEQSSDVMDISA